MASVIDVIGCKAQGGVDRGNFDGIFVKVDSPLREGKIANALQYSVVAVSQGGTGVDIFHVVVSLLAGGDQKGYSREVAEQIVQLIHNIQKEVDQAPDIK